MPKASNNKVRSELLIGNRKTRADTLKRAVRNELLGGHQEKRKRKAPDHTQARIEAENPCVRTNSRTPVKAPARKSEVAHRIIRNLLNLPKITDQGQPEFRAIPLEAVTEDPRLKDYIRRDEVLNKYLRKSEVERHYIKKSDLKKAAELGLAVFVRYIDYCE